MINARQGQTGIDLMIEELERRAASLLTATLKTDPEGHMGDHAATVAHYYQMTQRRS